MTKGVRNYQVIPDTSGIDSVYIADLKQYKDSVSVFNPPDTQGTSIRFLYDLDKIVAVYTDSASLAEADTIVGTWRASVFRSEDAQDRTNGYGITSTSNQNDWIATVLIFAFGGIAMIRYFDKVRFKNWIRGLLIPKEFEKFLRDDTLTIIPPLFLLFVICNLMNGASLANIAILSGFKPADPFIMLGGATVLWTSYLVLKFFIAWGLGIEFMQVKLASQYVVQLAYANFILACGRFVLLATLLGYELNLKEYCIIDISLVCISVIYTFIAHIGYNRFKSSWFVFYIILYLCTLEILPLAVLAKMISENG
jgi:hypothetical protein